MYRRVRQKLISHHCDDSNGLKKLHYKARKSHVQPLDSPLGTGRLTTTLKTPILIFDNTAAAAHLRVCVCGGYAFSARLDPFWLHGKMNTTNRQTKTKPLRFQTDRKQKHKRVAVREDSVETSAWMTKAKNKWFKNADMKIHYYVNCTS